MSVHYEIYVKPSDGPCSVRERDAAGHCAWVDKAEAIRIADHKKRRYPLMDFLVHEVEDYERRLVHDTSKQDYGKI